MSLASPFFDLTSGDGYAHDWALVDVETSGLIPRRDRVLSVAVVTVGPDGEQTGEFSTLLDPGCDPGPVDVHGLTAERLRGAPTFDQVAERIGAMLQNRILVAHNAQFDYDFLAYEFARARMWLPVSQRLCTLTLNRQVDPPTHDMSWARWPPTTAYRSSTRTTRWTTPGCWPGSCGRHCVRRHGWRCRCLS